MVVEVGILGFITGAIGFVATVRNAISRTLEDVDAVKSDLLFLVGARSRLILVEEKLLAWQTRWHIREGGPEGLPGAYWGPEGRYTILTHLDYIHAEAEVVHRDFASIHGAVLDTDHIGDMSFSASTQANKPEDLRTLQQCWKQKNSVASRTGKALLRFPNLETHLKRLETSTTTLEELSKITFVRWTKQSKEVEWESHITQTSSEQHLLKLATCNSQASTLIRDLLLETGGHAFELLLDHKAGPEQRLDVIESASRNEALCHHFCFSCPRSSSNDRVDFSCTILQKDIEIHRSYGQDDQGSSSAAKAFFATSITNPSSMYLQRGKRTLLVKKEPAHNNASEAKSECLRSFMATQERKTCDSLHGEFTSEERHRLAYELAEWTLLFLETVWFSRLCSCCICRVQTPDLATTFRFAVTPVAHIDPETGQHENRKQWCQEELKGMHIQRLGIVLAEIAIGYPVLDARLHRDGVDIDDMMRGVEVELRREDINRKVLPMGEDYMLAVDYCLRYAQHSDTLTQVDMREFYDNVVGRLYGYYEDLTIKKAEKRYKRRSARATVQARRANFANGSTH